MEAKTHFSTLLEKVQKGEVFHITKHGKVVAELRAVAKKRKTPKAGFAKGTFGRAARDFDEPLDDFKAYME